MRFAYVDGQKIGVIFVVLVDLNDVADLATKRRSGETAEDKNKRFSGSAFANVKVIGAVEGDEARIGGRVSNFQVAAMHVRQSVTHHVQGVFGATGHHAEPDKRKDDKRSETDADPHEAFPHETKLLALCAAVNLAREISSSIARET